MTTLDPEPPVADPLAAGRLALERGDWAGAQAAFAAAGESGEALEGLGIAARWRNDGDTALAAHEAAYRAFRARDDALGAARCAMWLGMETYLFRSEHAVAGGWLERADRLLAGLPPAPEHAWLAAWRAHVDLATRDTRSARLHTAAAAGIARALGLLDIEILALAQEGLTLVAEGHTAEGMRLLDAATATALGDEMTNLDAISTTCCYMIDACKRVRDFERALQWCDHVRAFCERWSDRMTFSACRTHYCDVLIWRGDWADAEREIDANLGDIAAFNPGRAPDALARLGELRRRQGRLDEAEATLAQAGAHQVALLARAELALDRGDAAGALEGAERYLRRVGADGRSERVPGLELVVRAHLRAGSPAAARAALDELLTAAAAVGTGAVRASARLAEGLVLAAEARPAEAAAALEDAAAGFERSGGRMDAARARLALAEALSAADRPRSAAEEAAAARDLFLLLGAGGEAGRAAALLRRLGTEPAAAAGDPSLTRREREILALIGRGLDNREIAERLVLSVRTVERHASNIYLKIGASGPSARALAATHATRQGLT
jgi:DNA-binding NarL/FixJ family response regulator